MLLEDKNLYYVGGVVRDELIGAESFDTDFCYEGNAIEFAKNPTIALKTTKIKFTSIPFILVFIIILSLSIFYLS